MVIPETYPNTHVLVNKLGLSDHRSYEHVMGVATLQRQYELETGSSPEGALESFDSDHLKQLHHHLFQDIFEWAGNFRGHDLRVGLCDVFTKPTTIECELKQVTDAIKSDNFLIGASKSHFISRMAQYLGWLGVIHPFSEGNGRTQRAFLQQLAKHSGYRMNFQKIPEWQNKVSAQRYHREREIEPLEILIETCIS